MGTNTKHLQRLSKAFGMLWSSQMGLFLVRHWSFFCNQCKAFNKSSIVICQANELLQFLLSTWGWSVPILYFSFFWMGGNSLFRHWWQRNLTFFVKIYSFKVSNSNWPPAASSTHIQVHVNVPVCFPLPSNCTISTFGVPSIRQWNIIHHGGIA